MYHGPNFLQTRMFEMPKPLHAHGARKEDAKQYNKSLFSWRKSLVSNRSEAEVEIGPAYAARVAF